MESKNSASVMMFSGVVSNENVVPSHFIKTGLKINSAKYIKFLQTVMFSWSENNYTSSCVMFI